MQAPSEFKGSLYTQKLPIKRTSGHYVIGWPLLARGHQAVEHIVSYTIYIYIYMLHLHPLILYDNVSCYVLYSVCCIHPTVCSSVPWGFSFYLLLARVARFWVSLMRPWNSLKFQAISNTSQTHQNGALRPPKDSKMVSKMVPETIKT